VLGKTLDGKYRVEHLLGSGGMGSVYAADEIASGKRVAIKVLHANRAESPDLMARFEREARVAGSIDTEHIVRCYATGTDPETQSPYMVLEYLVGEDLQRVVRRLGPLQPEVALRVLAQACVGVAKAHEAKIIHRDLKPANIFLAEGAGGVRTVKVLDFGVAKARRDPGDFSDSASAGGLTRTGAILGSPLYMSPEQARSVKNVDHRADLWSLGVVLYQMLAGRTPYEHISGLGDLILALCSDLPPSVQEFASWVPPEVAAITDRALRIEPSERFQSADEMLAAVRALLPQGVEVRDDMLVAVDAATQGNVAPTYFRRAHTSSSGNRSLPVSASRPPPPEVVDSLAGTLMSPSGRPLPGNQPTPVAIIAGAPSTSVATTGPGVVTPSNAPPKSSKVPVLAIAIACCLAGGGAVYLLTRQPPPAPVHDGGDPQTPATGVAPPVPAAPVPSATPVAHEEPAPPPSAAPTAPSVSAAPPPPSAAPTASAEATAPTASQVPHTKTPPVRPPGSAATRPGQPPEDLGPGSFGGRK